MAKRSPRAERLRVMVGIFESTDENAVKLALGIQEGVIEDTPVDTGYAANSWIPSVGAPSTQTGGSPDQVSGSEQALGTLSVLAWKPVSKGQVAHIVNNVEYILPLNGGSSTQAASGYIEKVIQREVSKANRRKLS